MLKVVESLVEALSIDLRTAGHWELHERAVGIVDLLSMTNDKFTAVHVKLDAAFKTIEEIKKNAAATAQVSNVYLMKCIKTGKE